jgi:hypothetical protein
MYRLSRVAESLSIGLDALVKEPKPIAGRCTGTVITQIVKRSKSIPARDSVRKKVQVVVPTTLLATCGRFFWPSRNSRNQFLGSFP